MISLEKKEIFNTIVRVAKLIELVLIKPNDKISNAIVETYLEYDIEQYNKDYRIFTDLISLRLLSYCEDSYLDLTNNDEINFDQIKNKIFINPEDSKKFSNKQIIKFIRNAVSHSDKEKELFKISPNGKYIEIELKKTKPVPFHVKINNKDLLEIVNIILPAAKGNYLTLINKNKKVVSRFYLKNINKEKMPIPENITCGTDEFFNCVKSFFEEKNIDYEIKEYPLLKEQIELIDNQEKVFSKVLEENPEYRNTFYLTLFDSTIPLSNEKIYRLYSYLQLYLLLNEFTNYTFQQFKYEIAIGYKNAFSKMTKDKTEQEPMTGLSEYIYDFQNTCGKTLEHYFQGQKYLSTLTNLTSNELLTYYFSCLCEEDIEINGIIYPKDNIRDAFVHGRYFNCLNGDIMCFDTNNGKNNDYNFYWKERLPLKETINSCFRDINAEQAKKVKINL